jgi:hypothetical protein
MGQARDEPLADRVSNADEYNCNVAGCALERRSNRSRKCEDHFGL